MPIPKPKPNEKQKDFMMRCVAKISKEYKKQEAIAICYNEYKNKNK